MEQQSILPNVASITTHDSSKPFSILDELPPSAGSTTPMALGALLSRALNEIINPVGCSITLYSAEILGRAGQVADQLAE